MNPKDLCESFGFYDDIVPNDEFDWNCFYELIDTGWCESFERGVKVCLA